MDFESRVGEYQEDQFVQQFHSMVPPTGCLGWRFCLCLPSTVTAKQPERSNARSILLNPLQSTPHSPSGNIHLSCSQQDTDT